MQDKLSGEDLYARFGGGVFRVVSDIHPLDAEQVEECLGDCLVLTLSKTFIDLFVPVSAEDARQRLWFAGKDGSLRQMTPEQAKAFWRAWDAGVQHVSEVILLQGLWY